MGSGLSIHVNTSNVGEDADGGVRLVSSSAIYNHAVEHYDRGEYETAREIFERLAEEKHVGRGLDVDTSCLPLIAFAESGAMTHEPPIAHRAAVAVGLIHLRQRSPPDYAQAVLWFIRAANQGSPEGMRHLALCYKNGHGVDADMKTAVAWFQRAADADCAEAHNDLGMLYLDGVGVTASSETACACFGRAAEGGSPDGIYNYAQALYLGVGCEPDLHAAERWARRGAEADNALCFWLSGRVAASLAAENVHYARRALDWFRFAIERQGVAGLGLRIVPSGDVTCDRVIQRGVFGLRKGRMGDDKVTVRRIEFVEGMFERERFDEFYAVALAEAVLWSGLKHANLVQLLAVTTPEDPAMLTIVSERIRGRVLDEIVRSDTPLHVAHVAEIALGVARALHCLHDARLAHQQLSLDKVYVLFGGADGRDVVTVKLCGMQLLGARRNGCELVQHAPDLLPYAAPEVLAGGSLHWDRARADVYSFAVLLFGLAAHELPWHASNLLSLSEYYDVVYSLSARPELEHVRDARLRSVIADCWAADPAQRPCMADVVTALEAIVSPPPAAPHKLIKKY